MDELRIPGWSNKMYANQIPAIEAEAARAAEQRIDVERLREQVRALQPERRTWAYRQGFDEAVMSVLDMLRPLAARPHQPDEGPG